MENTTVLEGDINQDIKEKAIVDVRVFPDEVKPENMPKPRHVCVSKFDGNNWVTRRHDNGKKIGERSHDFFMFGILNSGEFMVVSDEPEAIDSVANKIFDK